MHTPHGHLVPGTENEGYTGRVVRCGGPGLCKECSQYKYIGLGGTLIRDEAWQKEFGEPAKSSDEDTRERLCKAFENALPQMTSIAMAYELLDIQRNKKNLPVVWSYNYDYVIGNAEVNQETGEVVMQITDPRIVEEIKESQKIVGLSIAMNSRIERAMNPEATRDEDIVDWLGVVLKDEGISTEQALRIKNGLTDAIVNQLGDD